MYLLEKHSILLFHTLGLLLQIFSIFNISCTGGGKLWAPYDYTLWTPSRRFQLGFPEFRMTREIHDRNVSLSLPHFIQKENILVSNFKNRNRFLLLTKLICQNRKVRCIFRNYDSRVMFCGDSLEKRSLPFSLAYGRLNKPTHFPDVQTGVRPDAFIRWVRVSILKTANEIPTNDARENFFSYTTSINVEHVKNKSILARLLIKSRSPIAYQYDSDFVTMYRNSQQSH